MSVITQPLPTIDAVFRLSVDQYHEMMRVGILTEDDRIELLEGILVPKMSKNPPHRVATLLVRSALERWVPAGWYVDAQEPVTTSDSEPEPDIYVVRGQTRDYLDRHPGPEDVGLVVEVADTTLLRDRGTKKRVYANARIPVYWIVNLVDRQAEVYTDPTGAGETADYVNRNDYGADAEVPVVLDGKEIGRLPVRELLP